MWFCIQPIRMLNVSTVWQQYSTKPQLRVPWKRMFFILLCRLKTSLKVTDKMPKRYGFHCILYDNVSQTSVFLYMRNLMVTVKLKTFKDLTQSFYINKTLILQLLLVRLYACFLLTLSWSYMDHVATSVFVCVLVGKKENIETINLIWPSYFSSFSN